MLGASLKRLWHKLGSPRWFFSLTTPWVAFFGWSAAALLLWGTIWGLAYAPADYQQGNSFRIMYVHVPAAMLAQSLYIGMGVAGFIGLVWRMKLTYMGQLVGMGWTYRFHIGFIFSVCRYLCASRSDCRGGASGPGQRADRHGRYRQHPHHQVFSGVVEYVASTGVFWIDTKAHHAE